MQLSLAKARASTEGTRPRRELWELCNSVGDSNLHLIGMKLVHVQGLGPSFFRPKKRTFSQNVSLGGQAPPACVVRREAINLCPCMWRRMRGSLAPPASVLPARAGLRPIFDPDWACFTGGSWQLLHNSSLIIVAYGHFQISTRLELTLKLRFFTVRCTRS